MKNLILVGAVMVGLLVAGDRAGAQSGYDLFQKALAAERADGNPREAIVMYERIVKQFPGDRQLVARALVRIAECHEKLGQRDAAKVYERIVREFADQADSVTLARTRLNALAAPARPVSPTARQVWSGDDVDPMGQPSPDGRYLSFTDWSTGDLAIRDLVQGTSRRLTNSGGWEASGDYSEGSVFSPDGRSIAYSWFVDKGADPKAKCACRYELRVMALSGPDANKPRVVVQDPALNWIQPAAWTPDGRQLLVSRQFKKDGSGDIALVTVADGSVRALRTMGHFESDGPRLSPDGRFVVVDVSDPRTSARDIQLVSLSGEVVPLVEHSANDRAPVWSADGSHVLFLSDRTGGDSLWRIPVANGRATGPAVPMSSSLSGIHGLMTPTRDGGLFYWTGGASNNVYVAELDDTQRLKGTPTLAIERFLNANYLPSWSPDGQSIAYATQQGTRRPTKLMVRSLATGGDREVPFTKTPAGRVSWFPDGRSLLVAVVDQLHMNYYRVDIATGAAEEVMKTVTRSMPGRRPLVSADGSAIFYVDGPEEMANGRSMLMRFDLATGRRTMIRQVTAQDDSIASFELSPDGKQIAVRVDEGNTRANIFEVMATDGSGRRELFRTTSTGGERFGGLAWTSDQRFILFPDPVPSGAIALWKVSTNGGPAEETGIRMARNLGAPGVHGNRVVFGGREGGTPPTIWVLENFLPAKP